MLAAVAIAQHVTALQVEANSSPGAPINGSFSCACGCAAAIVARVSSNRLTRSIVGRRSKSNRVIFLAVPHRGSRLAAGILGSIGNRLIRHSKSPAQTMKELATQYPGILNPYFARVNARGGPTSLFWLAPNPLLDRLAAIPIKVPFHSIIGNRGTDKGLDSSDGIVPYRSSHLEGAESEKMVPAGHNLVSNPATVTEIKRILEENIVGRESFSVQRKIRGKKGVASASGSKAG